MNALDEVKAFQKRDRQKHAAGTIDPSRHDIQKDRAFLLLARIDGPTLKKQRQVIRGLLAESADIGDPELDYNEVTALRGIENLLDAIADFCHDELGMDTIIEDTDDLDYRGGDDDA